MKDDTLSVAESHAVLHETLSKLNDMNVTYMTNYITGGYLPTYTKA